MRVAAEVEAQAAAEKPAPDTSGLNCPSYDCVGMVPGEESFEIPVAAAEDAAAGGAANGAASGACGTAVPGSWAPQRSSAAQGAASSGKPEEEEEEEEADVEAAEEEEEEEEDTGSRAAFTLAYCQKVMEISQNQVPWALADVNGAFTSCNDLFARASGYHEDELKRATVINLTLNREMNRNMTTLVEMMTSEVPDGEFVLRGVSKNRKPMSLKLQCIRTQDGSVAGMSCCLCPADMATQASRAGL